MSNTLDQFQERQAQEVPDRTVGTGGMQEISDYDLARFKAIETAARNIITSAEVNFRDESLSRALITALYGFSKE